MVDVIRRIDIRATTAGVDKATAELRGLSGAQTHVAQSGQAMATVTDMSSRRQLSAAQAYDRLQRSIDATYAANNRFTSGVRTLDRAMEQGIITDRQRAQSLDMLRQKYLSADAAQDKLATGGGRLKGAFGGMGGLVGSFGAGLGLGMLTDPTILIRGIRDSITALDDLGDAASKAGVSAERLQVFRYALEQGEGSAADADAALIRLNKSIGDVATTGKGPAVAAFNLLGISVRDASGEIKSTEAVFDEVLTQMGRIEDQAAVAALSSRLFGREAGSSLAPLMHQGAAGIRAAATALEDLNGVQTQDVLDRADALDKKFKDLSTTVGTGLKSAAVFFGEGALAIVSHIEMMDDATNDFINSPSWRNFSRALLGETVTNKLDPMFKPQEIEERIGGAFDASRGSTDPALEAELLRRQKGTLDIPVLPDEDSEAATKEAEKAAKAIEKQREAVTDLITELEFEQRVMSMSAVDRRVEEELRQAGAAATDQQRLAIEGLVRSIEAEAEATKRAEDAQKEYEKAQDAAIDKMDEFRSGAKGMLSSLVEGGPAALLDEISSKLLDLGENMIISGLFGNQGEMGGGIFGDAIQGLLGRPEAPSMVATMGVQAGVVNVSGFKLPGLGESVTLPSNILVPPTGAASGSFRSAQEVGMSVAPLGAVTSVDLPNAPGAVEQQVWNSFKGMGLTDAQVAGVMGNVDVESGFNPTAVGDGGHAVGLFQHNDRLPALKSFAGADYLNPQKQIDFAQHELLTTEGRAFEALKMAQTPEEAARVWSDMFERPSVPHMEKRISSANQYYGSMAGAAPPEQFMMPPVRPETLDIVGQMDAELAPKISADLTNSFQQITDAIPPVGQDFIGDLGGGLGSITKNLTSLIPAGLGGGFSSEVTSAISSGFGGLFAEGGNLGAGKWGVAGERGPEVIHGPANITPMREGGGRQAPVNNFNTYNMPGAKGRMEARENESGGFDIDFFAETIKRDIRDTYGLKEPVSRWSR